jgi:hypothetical protein
VVKGALRGADLGEDVLDAELLVALGGYEPLTGIDEFVAPGCVGYRVDRTGRQWCVPPSSLSCVAGLTDRPSVYDNPACKPGS